MLFKEKCNLLPKVSSLFSEICVSNFLFSLSWAGIKTVLIEVVLIKKRVARTLSNSKFVCGNLINFHSYNLFLLL